jgi:thioredoxin 1
VASIELDVKNFDQVVGANETVVVDFWAPWCGPCRAFAPVFEAASSQHPDVAFAKVNTDVEQDLAAHFQIRSIPTLMIFRQQVVLFSQAGAMSGKALDDVLAQVKALDMTEVQRQIAEQQAQQQ